MALISARKWRTMTSNSTLNRTRNLAKERMVTITANQLKTQGVSSIDRAMEEASEVIISVRGKPRYVVIPIEEYDRLRESEIEAAWMQVRREVAEEAFVVESGDEHIDKEQAYFWTEAWQEGEREAEEDIRAGRVNVFNTPDDLFAELDEGTPDE